MNLYTIYIFTINYISNITWKYRNNIKVIAELLGKMFESIFEAKRPIVQQTTMLICSTMQECMDHKEVSLNAAEATACPYFFSILSDLGVTYRRGPCRCRSHFPEPTDCLGIMRNTLAMLLGFLTDAISQNIITIAMRISWNFLFAGDFVSTE